MQTHEIDTHQNQDKVLKESLSLFKGGTLDFLDEDLTDEVSDILSTEITETTTKKAYADNALKLSNNTGLHIEGEADISMDDMKRFASYHVDLSRKHDITFTTVIITTKKPSAAKFTSPSMNFAPKIINLKERDADETLKSIKAKLDAGEYDSINLLEILYLPLYGSKSGKSTPELLDAAIKLTSKVTEGDKQKKTKLQSLLILLTSTFISNEERNKILEVNMLRLEGNPAVKTLEDRGRNLGRNQEKIAIATNMLRGGYDVSDISKMTGLELPRIYELQDELQLVD